jgi:hypothetical protein
MCIEMAAAVVDLSVSAARSGSSSEAGCRHSTLRGNDAVHQKCRRRSGGGKGKGGRSERRGASLPGTEQEEDTEEDCDSEMSDESSDEDTEELVESDKEDCHSPADSGGDSQSTRSLDG